MGKSLRARGPCGQSEVTSGCHCAIKGLTGHQETSITACMWVCAVCVLKMGSLGTWSQEAVLLQPLPCAYVYMLRMPYAKWLVLLLRFPLAALPHSQLNEELSETSSHLKQSDIELLGLLIKNFTPDSSHEHFWHCKVFVSLLFTYNSKEKSYKSYKKETNENFVSWTANHTLKTGVMVLKIKICHHRNKVHFKVY